MLQPLLQEPLFQVIEGAPLDAAFPEDPVTLDAALQDAFIEDNVAPEKLQVANKRKPIQQQVGKKKMRRGE